MSLFSTETIIVPPRAGYYGVLYPDPPWPERGGGQIKRGADRHYPLMSVDAIVGLPFGDWAAPDAHLYLWVTNNYFEAGFRCIRSWGFRYITCVTWVKDRPGLGQYFRGRTEHCLFAVRGRLPYRTVDGTRAQGETVLYEPEPDLPAAFEAARTVHSRKPAAMRAAIERVSGDVPRVELFARTGAPGWDAWGNEAPKEASE